MKRTGRTAALVLGILAAVVGATLVGAPANRAVEERAADPIIGARRVVLGFLRGLGFVDPPPLFGTDPYLPGIRGSEAGTTGPDGSFVVEERMEIQQAPVYRGILWPVGDRYTYRTTDLSGHRTGRRGLRLCCVDYREKRIVGTSTREAGGIRSQGEVWEVGGYVPRSATAYWVEEIDGNGEVHSLDAWGDVSPFWRD